MFFSFGVLFVAVHQQSVVPGPSGHMFWLGLLVGLAAVILPGGFRVLMAIVAVFARGWVHLVGHHVSFSSRLVPWVLVALRRCSRIGLGAETRTQAAGRIRLPNTFW